MIFNINKDNNSLINSKNIINTNRNKSRDELSSKENDRMNTTNQVKKLMNGNIETNSKIGSDNDDK